MQEEKPRQPKCRNCIFAASPREIWDDGRDYGYTLPPECRRYPPRELKIGTKPSYPIIDLDEDWCGEIVYGKRKRV